MRQRLGRETRSQAPSSMADGWWLMVAAVDRERLEDVCKLQLGLVIANRCRLSLEPYIDYCKNNVRWYPQLTICVRIDAHGR